MLLRYFRRGAEPAHLTTLRDVPLFSGLSTHELETLDDLLHQRRYLAGEVIFDQHEEGQAIYFIRAGQVSIQQQDKPDSVAMPAVGEFFGERALLENAPRIAQARAVSDCELAVLFREDFFTLLHTHPQIAQKISQHCSLRNANRPLPPAAPPLLANLREVPGAITWVGIIASTCLLLFLFKKILWLVVPFLLALMLYYLLAPLEKRMVLAGFSRKLAAVSLSGAFLLLTGLVVLLSYPRALANAGHWQVALLHYLNGGVSLLDQMLQSLQGQFGILISAQLANQLSLQFHDFVTHFSDKHLGNLALGFASLLPSLLLTPIITFFMLKDGARLRKLLGSAVPNAFFEKTLYLMHAVDRTARLYFVGLIKLTLIDALLVSGGLWLLGFSSPVLLGLLVAVLAWIPYLGPLLGFALVTMVAATDFPGNLALVYGVVGLFLGVRLLDDLVFLPAIVGRSLNIHPLLTIMMFLVGEAIAGVAGLMLVIPILGIVMVLGETLEIILTDRRLQARHAYAQNLRWQAAKRGLT